MSCDGLHLPCAACGKDGTKLRCPCKRASYCNKKCQLRAWPIHMKICAVHFTKQLAAICGTDGGASPLACDARNELARVLTEHGRFEDAVAEYQKVLQFAIL